MPLPIRPRRSALYMPGSNARALEKAKTLSADCLILDLEDAVAPDKKAEARQQVATAVSEGGFGHREVIVRINGFDTPWGEEDLKIMAPVGADAILVPKVSSAASVHDAADRLAKNGASAQTSLWVMMETPLAIFNALEIAATTTAPDCPLTCFVLGTNDLAKDTGAQLVPGRLPMVSWIQTCLAAARVHGLTILDGVYNELSDLEGFEAECQQGVTFGMDGKTLIHPRQVDPCNTAFSPAPEIVSWARKIVGVFEEPENAGKGAVQVEGRMVERLHADIAKRTIAVADAIAERTS